MIKSLFITLFLVYLMVGAAITGIHFAENVKSLTAFTAMLAHLIGLGWFIYIYTLSKVNANFVSILVTVGSGISALISFASYKMNGDGFWIDVKLASIAFIGWLIYHYFYTKLAVEKNHVQVGDRLPDGVFTDKRGHEVSLSSISGKRLLVFHQGNWCPFCVEHQKDLNAHQDAFHQKGTSLIFVSSQTPKSEGLSGTFDLQDKSVQYGEQLGIAGGPSLPLGLSFFGFKPTIHIPFAVLVDENQTVIAFHKTKDYRTRPTADYFLRYLN